MTATELFALAHNSKCEGPDRCHWCGASCRRLWLHDDPPPIPFTKSKSNALYPSNAYICSGCWLYRRRRSTVLWLEGGYRDSQSNRNLSWWIDGQVARAIRQQSRARLWELLLKPPHTFSLSLVEDNTENWLHHAPVNDIAEVRIDTPIAFNLNNIQYKYTIYEIEEATRSGELNGKNAGVTALFRMFGPPPNIPERPKDKRERGRPPPAPDGRSTKKAIRMSGTILVE